MCQGTFLWGRLSRSIWPTMTKGEKGKESTVVKGMLNLLQQDWLSYTLEQVRERDAPCNKHIADFLFFLLIAHTKMAWTGEPISISRNMNIFEGKDKSVGSYVVSQAMLRFKSRCCCLAANERNIKRFVVVLVFFWGAGVSLSSIDLNTIFKQYRMW